MDSLINGLQVGATEEQLGSFEANMSSEILKAESSKRKTKKGIMQVASNSEENSVRTEVSSEGKNVVMRITFEGEAASRIQKCEMELRERLSKPDMGAVIGKEILSWSEKRWAEIVEENTDVEYFFAQIRKCNDRAKSIKLLKALAEKLKHESAEESALSAEEMQPS